MIVNFEFLGNEPIENVITCLHFKIDKVVYFGYHEVIQSQRSSTERFLTKYCGVQQVVFHELARDDLQAVLQTMRAVIGHEVGIGGKPFFDVTGGESLLLVAFGMLAREFDTPMHLYDIPKNQLIELDEGSNPGISRTVVEQHVKLSLERFVEMRGGMINYRLHKNMKDEGNAEFERDVLTIWEISKHYNEYWNQFSDFLKQYMIPDNDLQVNQETRIITKRMSGTKGALKNLMKYNRILEALSEKGIINDLVYTNENYHFCFKNREVKACLWEGGSSLEWYIFLTERKSSDDCLLGVHLDWDGVEQGFDVVNEVDVLSLKGCVPTIISCKSGKMNSQVVLHALYELDTVARRFGGKYARKVLATTRDLSPVHRNRAAEMGIEVRCEMNDESVRAQ